MKYTKVEVLKDIPGIATGTYPIVQNLEIPERSYIVTEPINFSLWYMKLYPDFFRLISEPEFVVGGCAKAARTNAGLTKGVIYPVLRFDGQFIWIGEGDENAWSKTCFIPSTLAEYTAQEEAKKPWRPKEYDEMFFIGVDGFISSTSFVSTISTDANIVRLGNCFKTHRAAMYFLDKYLKPAFEKYAADYPNISSEYK